MLGKLLPSPSPQFSCKALLIILVSLACIFFEIPQDSQALGYRMKSFTPASICLFVRTGSFYLMAHIRTLGSKMGSSASSIPSSHHLCVSISFFHPPVNFFRPNLCGSGRRETVFFHQTQVFAEGLCFHCICHWQL